MAKRKVRLFFIIISKSTDAKKYLLFNGHMKNGVREYGTIYTYYPAGVSPTSTSGSYSPDYKMISKGNFDNDKLNGFGHTKRIFLKTNLVVSTYKGELKNGNFHGKGKIYNNRYHDHGEN